MNDREFQRRAAAYAKREGLRFRFRGRQGKGSHGRIHVGSFSTTVKRGEFSRDLLMDMLRQLHIPRKEFFR